MGRAPPKEGAVDIQQLRFIVATAQRGSFTDAADALYVSRAALSKSVSRLESELGFPLFDRTCDGVRLTDAGKRFVEKAMPVVEGFKELQGTIHQEHRVTTVTVGLPLTWTDFFPSLCANSQHVTPISMFAFRAGLTQSSSIGFATETLTSPRRTCRFRTR